MAAIIGASIGVAIGLISNGITAVDEFERFACDVMRISEITELVLAFALLGSIFLTDRIRSTLRLSAFWDIFFGTTFAMSLVTSYIVAQVLTYRELKIVECQSIFEPFLSS